MRGLVALSLAVLSLVAPSGARAHGRPPRVTRIAFDPSDPDRMILAATFGLIVTDDAGASWRWVCAGAYDADPTQEDPDVQIMGDGAVVLAPFAGLRRTERELCGYSSVSGEGTDAYVVDLVRDPRDATRLYGLASSGTIPDALIRSDDGGQTFTRIGAPIDMLLTERVLLPPTDPSRVYVSAALVDPTTPRGFVLRSSDGGASFERTELPMVSGERRIELLGADPTNADRLFVRVARGNVDPRPERLLESRDGGLSFTPLLELPAILGFAIAEDGQTIWVGSGNGGLLVARDGVTAFEQLDADPVRCLALHEGALYVCAEQLTSGFALGRSTDGGRTVEGVMRFQDVEELVSCPRCSSVGVTCPAWEPDLRADLMTYFGGADAGMTGLPRDAGIPAECVVDGGGPPPPPPPPGCGCAARPPLRPAAAVPIALALLALRARRGRRSAGRSRTSRR